MNKFQVGDKVTIVDAADFLDVDKFRGKIGTVIFINVLPESITVHLSPNHSGVEYRVEYEEHIYPDYDYDKRVYYFDGSELVKVERV